MNPLQLQFRIFNKLIQSYTESYRYSDMTTEEKVVVDEFDGGEKEYNKIYSNPEKYLVQNTSDLLRLEETA